MTTVDRPTAPAKKPLRRDAERNRQLILDAAGDLFAEQGIDAGFDEIARLAGVGVGTVYRRFPDRKDLVEALFTQRIDAVVALAERANAMADPWQALVWFTEESLRMQASDKGLKQVLMNGGRGHDGLAAARDHLIPAIRTILQRAQASGDLRPDVEVFDLAAITSALSALTLATQPELWQRYAVLVLDGLRASRATHTPLPLAAPGEEGVAELAGRPGRRAQLNPP